MTLAEPAAKPGRRRQEDRTADTRRRIIDATIRCLYRGGYSSVTNAMVAEEAGVSRGIIGYHFATKADRMVAVRDAVHQDERRAVDEIRKRIGTEAYVREMPRHVVAGMRRAPAIAVDEILLAARADPELSARLRATENEIDARSLRHMLAYYAELGLEPPADITIRMRVAVAAFRGLAIAEVVQGEDAQIDACVDYLIKLLDPALPERTQETADP
jgi:AcrR family transcriptional regulator